MTQPTAAPRPVLAHIQTAIALLATAILRRRTRAFLSTPTPATGFEKDLIAPPNRGFIGTPRSKNREEN